MIVTLTPNPSVDRTVCLGSPLVRGGVNRLESVTVEPGGKGINVARVLRASGQDVVAVLPAGDRDPLLDVLATASGPDLRTCAVPVRHAARINTAVTEPDGTTTKLNEPGGGLSSQECAALEDAVVQTVLQSDDGAPVWAVLSGSLPPGVPTDWYVQLVARLRKECEGLSIAVDTSDAPLLSLAQALPDVAPDLIKPNGEELGQLADVELDNPMALEEGAMRGELQPVVDAASRLVQRGVKQVLATLGPAGAVLVSQEGAWYATAPDVPVRSTVGAGDSSVAGYVLAAVRGGDQAERLATAMAYGSAAASLPGTRLPRPEDLPALRPAVTRLA